MKKIILVSIVLIMIFSQYGFCEVKYFDLTGNEISKSEYDKLTKDDKWTESYNKRLQDQRLAKDTEIKELKPIRKFDDDTFFLRMNEECRTKAAYETARKLGYTPLIVYVNEEGGQTKMSGTIHLDQNGQPALLDGDIAINVGYFTAHVGDQKIYQGECIVKEKGQFRKLPDCIRCIEAPQSDRHQETRVRHQETRVKEVYVYCAVCGSPAIGYCTMRNIQVCATHRYFKENGKSYKCPS